jgi:hypothetical protein
MCSRISSRRQRGAGTDKSSNCFLRASRFAPPYTAPTACLAKPSPGAVGDRGYGDASVARCPPIVFKIVLAIVQPINS